MTEIELKVREYGQKRATKDLQNYIDELPVDDIIQVIQNRINRTEFSTFWNYLLQAFTATSESHRKRFKIVQATIEELSTRDVSTSTSGVVITRLCMELEKFKIADLVVLCSACTEQIQKGSSLAHSWQELLPKLLDVIVERESVEYNDIEMTGLEYKTQYINSLCMLQWSTNIVIPLTAMFIDMPLSKDEHSQVVNKLGQYMEKLTCQEVPSFVYQLLKLCRHQNSRSIFLLLQNYFGQKIYSRELQANFTNSETMDLIGDSMELECVQAESTVLFHIYQSALLGHDSIKDYLSSLKTLTKSPEFVLHPFQLTALLTISTVTFYEDRVFEVVRVCIARSFHEEIKKSESAWFRDMIPNSPKIETVIKQIIEFSVQERDLVLQGLVNLGFVLLGVGTLLFKTALVEKQWSLGKFILLSLIKQKPHVAHSILQRLCNYIITGQNAAQCIDCFHSLTRKFALITLENKSCVVELMEALLQVPENVAGTILDAVIPLTKLSPTIRDHLIVLLRKALYSRITGTRQMAVKGFLKLLRNLKISNLAALSQPSSSNSSSYSVLTQISLTRARQSTPSVFTNEALCLEVLGILRRCFMQQAEVRAKLYDGLYDAVCMNPDIGEPVLNVLWSHLCEYYVIDEDVLPPLQFSKITVTKDLEVVLQEPLGKLIYTFGLIVAKVLEADKENDAGVKFAGILGSMCVRMANCELVHLELDDGSNLLDILPESQQKLIVLKEAMCVYEALIGFKLSSWCQSSEKYAQDINSLFQGYSRLSQCMKNLSKPKKGVKKKKDANKTTQQSESTTKIHDTSSNKTKMTKLPNTLLDLQVLVKALQLLHGNVNWTTVAQANVLKQKVEIHHHVMQATMQQFQAIKNIKSKEHHNSKLHYKYCTEVATLLYERCITRFEDFTDFDVHTALLALECFQITLQLICNNYNDDLKLFLSVVAGNDSEEDFITLLKSFIETYEKLFELDDQTASNDPESKRLSLIILGTLSLLAEQIPIEINDLSAQFLEWLKQFAHKHTMSNKAVVAAFVTLWFETYVKFKSGTAIFEKVIDNLNHVMGTMGDSVELKEELKLVNEVSAHGFVQSLMNVLKVMLDDADWIIVRLRAEYAMMTYPGEHGTERRREYLKGKERGMCCQLCLLINIVDSLTNILIPCGVLSEAVLKSVASLYNTLNLLTKYFMVRSTKINVAFQAARFEKVVKISGKQLSPNVHRFILHIEEQQKEEIENSDAKKKSTGLLKSKVLRETKLIPKVVFEIEQFSKSVIQLSNKTKVDLSKYIGQGSTRDFRIKDLKSVIEQTEAVLALSLPEGSSDGSDATRLNQSTCDSESEAEVPPTKKAKN